MRDELLAPHRAELEAQLDEMEDKVEVNVKGIYDEPAILREVVAEDREIAQLRELDLQAGRRRPPTPSASASAS